MPTCTNLAELITQLKCFPPTLEIVLYFDKSGGGVQDLTYNRIDYLDGKFIFCHDKTVKKNGSLLSVGNLLYNIRIFLEFSKDCDISEDSDIPEVEVCYGELDSSNNSINNLKQCRYLTDTMISESGKINGCVDTVKICFNRL